MGVVKFSDYQPQREVVERKVASLDDGYMRVATSIGKLKPKLKLAGREHQVLDAVIYCTFGWNKSEDKVTNTYLAEVTDLDDSDVAAALNVLAERNIINLRKVGGFKLVSVNVSIDKWVLKKTPKTPPNKLGETTQNVGRKRVSSWAESPDTKDSLTKDNKTPLNPPEGKEALALECLDFYNSLAGARCSSPEAFVKALNTVKAKGVCYSVDELKLVIKWAVTCWDARKTPPKPNNICRMTRFDGYLSDALVWADGQGSNPATCPHAEIIALWNEKFPAKAVSPHEWNRRRPAHRDLEAVWNGKTSQGNWRELRHMGMAFDLIGKSSLFATKGDQPWLTLDWILNPKNWGSVYEQAINEHKQRKGVTA